MRRPLRDWSALAAAFVAGGVLMSVVSAPAQDPAPGDAPLVADVDDPALKDLKLAEQQRKMAEEALEVIAVRQRDAAMTPTDDAVIQWNRRLAEARLALAKNADERAAAVGGFVDHMKRALEIVELRFQGGQATRLEVLDTQYGLVEAERWLTRSRGR